MSTQSGTTPTIEKADIERIFLGFAVEAQKQMTEEIEVPKRKVIILAGPTACGKSEFAINLAKEIHGEIVSADAMQIYKGMDIGTAKVPPEARVEVPHHLVDEHDITDIFNVVDFFYEARQCCEAIHSRNAVPIVVGGSGFYLHSLIYGPPSGPPSVPELRAQLQEEMDKFGIEAMFERLRKLDPQYASTITKNDKQKIIRALEILTITGQKVSQLSWKGRKITQNFDFCCWFLYRPKEIIYERINDRCDEMLQKGFLDEVKYLKEEGILENSSASQAIGYRQALEYLNSQQTEEDYTHFVESFKRASRKYAKRQFTWFRNEPLFRWLDLDMHDPEVAREMIHRDYEKKV